MEGDFFDHVAASAADKYDLIFDRRFLHCLAPAWRQRWARQMRQLLSERGGRLVLALDSVAAAVAASAGPPYAIGHDAAAALLRWAGLEQLGATCAEGIAPSGEDGPSRPGVALL